MSRQAVDFVIEALLTDWDLREGFVRDPLGMLADLHIGVGLELTLDEMRALIRTDPEVWSPGWSDSAAVLHH